MLQLILMLLGLAFGNNNANTTNNDDNNQNPVILQSDPGTSDPGTGTGGNEGDTSGETTQLPPKK